MRCCRPPSSARRRAPALCALAFALLGAACRSNPSGATPLQQRDPGALATLQAVTGAGTGACNPDADAAVAAVAAQYPDAPEVMLARRAHATACQDWPALAEVLRAIPDASRVATDTANLARIEIRYLQEFDKGEAHIKPLAAADPTNVDYASLLAAALYYQQRFAEAVPNVDALWQPIVASKNVDIMTMRAEAFMEEGKVERAIRILNDVLKINPRHEFARNVLSRAMAIGGDGAAAADVQATTEAMRVTREAETANTTWVNDRLNELRAAFDAGRFAEAERLAHSIIPRLPEARKHEMYRTLKDVYIALGRFDDADKALGIAAALELGTPEAALDTAFTP
ncbi:MAG: hypothetical protein IPG72_03430 [Ardenticatenales bacterium]|jgi:tetratricopeptide (TPR) repeat protein|nr:hypothetical protein [Ardenticatenales bacterium]